MNRYKILALDETGKASLKHPSKNFILSGIIIPESFKPKLARKICKLNKKHFNNDEIVLHCRDVLRKKGPFACLREDPQKEIGFWSELTSILNIEEISLAFIITNKNKAKKLGWNETAILKKTYDKMLEEFTIKHLKSSNGKIITESESHQDQHLIRSHNKLQCIGIPSHGINGSSYREKITSLSLVNKLNLDADIQLADTLAIMADMVYKIKIGKTGKIDKTQRMMKRLIERKMKSNSCIFEILT